MNRLVALDPQARTARVQPGLICDHLRAAAGGHGLTFSVDPAPGMVLGVAAAAGPTDTSWPTAFYYSGFCLTTLGTGDVVAASGPYRLLSIAESGVGFITFSMVITYFLS